MNHSSSKFLRYVVQDINEPSVLPYQKEINETPENRITSLEILRRELQSFKDFEICMDEEFLLRYLRVSKFDTERAIQRVLNYYRKADALIEMYKKVTFPLQKAESLGHLFISPYRCQNNSFLVLGNGGIVDYKKFTFAERFYLEILFVHEIIENPVNQICGGTYIFDYEGFNIHGFLALTPGWNVFPCRLKAVHIVNAPSIFSPIWKFGQPFVSKKILTRFFLHTKNDDWEKLHAHISPEILPEKYGGKLKQEELINCLEDLEEMEKKFRKMLEFGFIKTKKNRQAHKVFH
ncbi:alpha-tocopherol transfer protein-like isoform X2 [Argiope bruennichi]|uniref:alpha-tocopherol transfer protein-like isoform X2 n=1 Tax=Argiope bruennichi TaxID=94029 RepID=UPI00249443BD|nr:alpha-tocopherol transfer protein-like isoform X2 [Argiope bruennichi]